MSDLTPKKAREVQMQMKEKEKMEAMERSLKPGQYIATTTIGAAVYGPTNKRD